jgi:hypothetical protein
MTRFILIVAILVCALCGFVARAYSQVNVTQKNNSLSRDGLYIDPAFTPVNAANLVRDLNFDGQLWATFMRNRCTSRAARTGR